MSSIGNVGRIFSSPSGVALDIASTPDWKVPLVVVILLTVIFTAVLYPFQLEYQRDMLEKFQKETGREMDIDALTRPSMAKRVTGLVGAAVMVSLFVLVASAILNGVAMLVGGSSGFTKMFSLLAYTMIIASAGNLVKVPLVMAKGSIDAARLSLAAFAPGLRLESAAGLALSSTDVFAVWTVVATVIGFGALTGLGNKKSAVIVVGFYALFVLLQIGMALLTARAMA
jgi:hypothetical protein